MWITPGFFWQSDDCALSFLEADKKLTIAELNRITASIQIKSCGRNLETVLTKFPSHECQ